MKILNYGAGAVGLGLDSCLLKAGVSVDILAREKTVRALRRFGLKRSGIFGRYHAKPREINCYSSLDQLIPSPYDIILVSTKSFNSETAAKDISHHPQLLSKPTKIVLCQNGWGNAEVFAKYFSKKQIYNARVITGFTRPQLNEVKITVHADTIRMGSLYHQETRSIESLCEMITLGGIPCKTTKTIEKDLWAKMFYNCALNSLGAIFNVPYGALGKSFYSRQLMENIIDEVYAVMKKAGYKTHWLSAQKYLKIFYNKQLPSTARHRSSTLQDITIGRRTEIDALNGMVICMAEKLRVAVPVNRSVYSIVKFLEEKNPHPTPCTKIRQAGPLIFYPHRIFKFNLAVLGNRDIEPGGKGVDLLE